MKSRSPGNLSKGWPSKNDDLIALVLRDRPGHAKGTFAFVIGKSRVALPVSTDDMMWFVRSLREKGVDLRRATSAPVAHARDLAITMHAARLAAAHELLPRGVGVDVELRGLIDVPVAAAVSSLVRTLRWAERTHQNLFEAAWRFIFAGAPLAVPQKRTEDRDHVWEFLNAAAYSEFGDDVDINPGDEGVDVVGRMDGARWGIECKALYTSSPERRADRIIDGVKQIENDSRIDSAFVAVNLTNVIDHEPFRRSLEGTERVFATREDARDALKVALRAVATATDTPQFRKRWAADKSGKPRTKCRGVIYLAQTVALAGGRVDVFTAQFSSLRAPATPAAKDFVSRYHTGWALSQIELPPPTSHLIPTLR